MAPKNPDLQKHTLNLRRGDVDFLEHVYLPKGLPVSVIVRSLVSAHVDRLRAQESPLSLKELTNE